jgi:hypothetical protein
LFLHSFSFLKWSRDRKVTSPNLKTIDILNKTIDLLKSSQIEILTMKEFHIEYKKNPNKFIGEDVMPELGFKNVSSSLIRKTQKFILA